MSQNVPQPDVPQPQSVITIIPMELPLHYIQSAPQNYIEITAETISTTPLRRSPQPRQPRPTALDDRFVQPVSLDYFTTATSPDRPNRHSPSSPLAPNWLLMCSWLGLGIGAIVISIRAWILVFFPAAPALAAATSDNGELPLRLLGAAIVNLCSLAFFSALGHQIGRQLQLAPHRIHQLRRIRRAFYARTLLGRICRPLFRY